MPIEARKIRYIFTIALRAVEMPDDPVAQRAFLNDTIEKLKKNLDVEQVGLIAVVDNQELVYG